MQEEFDYSQEGKAARDLFVSDYATHIFYVEDTGAEIFYERLFQKLFPKLSDFLVVCLHGKSNVQKKVSEPRVQHLTYVFVVDKDFDDLLGPPQKVEFVYFDRYSVENYLDNLSALISVLVEEYPDGSTAQKAQSDCQDYATYRGILNSRLTDITRYFVVVRRFCLNMPTSKVPVAELLEGGNDFHPMPTLEWIKSYRTRVIEESGLTEPDLDHELGNALVPSLAFPDGTMTPLFHVPGKLLLSCILKYVSARTVPEFERKLGKALHTRILNHLDLAEFSVFKQRMLHKHADLSAYL